MIPIPTLRGLDCGGAVFFGGSVEGATELRCNLAASESADLALIERAKRLTECSMRAN